MQSHLADPGKAHPNDLCEKLEWPMRSPPSVFASRPGPVKAHLALSTAPGTSGFPEKAHLRWLFFPGMPHQRPQRPTISREMRCFLASRRDSPSGAMTYWNHPTIDKGWGANPSRNPSPSVCGISSTRPESTHMLSRSCSRSVPNSITKPSRQSSLRFLQSFTPPAANRCLARVWQGVNVFNEGSRVFTSTTLKKTFACS